MTVADGALAGRIVAVTGASSGIGAATAARMRELGATVTALARRRAQLDGVRAVALDVTDPAAAREAFAGFERLDVLVAAAGTNLPARRLDELEPEGWDAVVATNLTGAFNVISAALPALRAADGLVIVIGSVSGAWPDRSGPAYQAAKAGVLAFARGAALEEHERGSGVRFSVLAPGMVATPLLDQRPEPPPPEARAGMLQPADVAEVCAFLAALPGHVHVPELTLLPHGLQALGRTG